MLHHMQSTKSIHITVEIDSKHFLNDLNDVITSCPKYTIIVSKYSIYVFNKK